jgi:hypothetical protein
MSDMETKQIISWLLDKAARAQDHSYARMLNQAAKRLKELDATDNNVVGKEPGYGWIPLSLFSPEGECLAVATIKGMPSCGEMLIGYIGRDGRSASGYIAESDTEILMEVTHWMPLPEPPKEVDNG